MMKHPQSIFTKYCGRAVSTIASSRSRSLSGLSSSVKGSWKKQDGLALTGAFLVGWVGHALINVYHRREHWYKVDRLLKETDTRTDEVNAIDTQYRTVIFEKLRAIRKSTT